MRGLREREVIDVQYRRHNFAIDGHVSHRCLLQCRTSIPIHSENGCVATQPVTVDICIASLHLWADISSTKPESSAGKHTQINVLSLESTSAESRGSRVLACCYRNIRCNTLPLNSNDIYVSGLRKQLKQYREVMNWFIVNNFPDYLRRLLHWSIHYMYWLRRFSPKLKRLQDNCDSIREETEQTNFVADRTDHVCQLQEHKFCWPGIVKILVPCCNQISKRKAYTVIIGILAYFVGCSVVTRSITSLFLYLAAIVRIEIVVELLDHLITL